MRREPLSCQDVNQFILDYLEGNLDDRTRMQFEAHLHNCPVCERFFNQYRNTVGFVRDDTNIDVPDDVIANTLDFLKNHYDD